MLVADNNMKLTALHLSNNLLADNTAQAFAALLQTNRTLRHLNLSWNAIKVGKQRACGWVVSWVEQLNLSHGVCLLRVEL
jgi:hypothetical protein